MAGIISSIESKEESKEESEEEWDKHESLGHGRQTAAPQPLGWRG